MKMQLIKNKPRIEQTVQMLVEAVNELIEIHNRNPPTKA